MKNKEQPQLRSAEEITLQEFKDQVAKRHYYDTWGTLCPNGNLDGVPDEWVTEAAELYASQFKSRIKELEEYLFAERHLVNIKNNQLELKQKEVDRLKDDLFTVADPDHPEYKSIKERYNT